MLSTKEARELAREWASSPQVRGLRCPAMASLDGFPIESLLGWVSETMKREHEKLVADFRRGPTPAAVAGWSGEDAVTDPGDPEALARTVSHALGEPFTDDLHGLTWDLCELAGWPDDEEESP